MSTKNGSAQNNHYVDSTESRTPDTARAASSPTLVGNGHNTKFRLDAKAKRARACTVAFMTSRLLAQSPDFAPRDIWLPRLDAERNVRRVKVP